MKNTLIGIFILLIFASLAFAQQDPDDPGIQDSLIVGSVHVDSGASLAFIPVYAVTDDSITFYNFSIRWFPTEGGVFPAENIQYFYPLTHWLDIFDTFYFDNGYLMQSGYANDYSEDWLFTNMHRTNVWTYTFAIDPGTPSQIIILDSTWNPIYGSLIFGTYEGLHEFSPAFVPGYISIGSVSVGDNSLVSPGCSIGPNYPNPFNPSTTIEFTLQKSGPVALVIYDLLGREIRRLADNNLESGAQSVIWDSRDASGIDVPSGVYFYKLTTLGFSDTKRMTLIR